VNPQGHWDTYKRLYIGGLIFVMVWAGAAEAVFGSYSPADLNALSGRALLLAHVKCWALATANLYTYVATSQKTTTSTTDPKST
jgi:hypothetical protein